MEDVNIFSFAANAIKILNVGSEIRRLKPIKQWIYWYWNGIREIQFNKLDSLGQTLFHSDFTGFW